jgi:hypothetical protein
MKKAILLTTVLVILFAITACDGFLLPLTALERVAAFIADATTNPQDYSEMQAHFDSTAADYVNMLSSAYWDLTFFAEADQAFTLTGTAEAGVGDYGATSVKVTGTIENGFAATRDVEFHLLPDGTLDGNFLIRKIVVDPLSVFGPPEIIQTRW